MMNFKISTAPRIIKLILIFFLFVLALGYIMGLLNVYDKTHLSYDGTVKHIRGSEEEMIYEKGFGDMVSVSHTHLGAWAMMFFFVIGIFLFSSFSEKLKSILGVLSFVFIVLDQIAMWLTRYVAEPFAWVFMLSGAVMAFLFYLLIAFNLYELLLRKQVT